jgi:hypothetical protein
MFHYLECNRADAEFLRDLFLEKGLICAWIKYDSAGKRVADGVRRFLVPSLLKTSGAPPDWTTARPDFDELHIQFPFFPGGLFHVLVARLLNEPTSNGARRAFQPSVTRNTAHILAGNAEVWFEARSDDRFIRILVRCGLDGAARMPMVRDSVRRVLGEMRTRTANRMAFYELAVVLGADNNAHRVVLDAALESIANGSEVFAEDSYRIHRDLLHPFFQEQLVLEHVVDVFGPDSWSSDKPVAFPLGSSEEFEKRTNDLHAVELRLREYSDRSWQSQIDLTGSTSRYTDLASDLDWVLWMPAELVKSKPLELRRELHDKLGKAFGNMKIGAARPQSHSVGFLVQLPYSKRVMTVDFVPMIRMDTDSGRIVWLVTNFDEDVNKWELTASPFIGDLPNKKTSLKEDLRWVVRALKAWKAQLCENEAIAQKTPVPSGMHLEVFARLWYGTLQSAGVNLTKMDKKEKLQSALCALAMHLFSSDSEQPMTPCPYPGWELMQAWWKDEGQRNYEETVADPTNLREMRDTVPESARRLLAGIVGKSAESLPPQNSYAEVILPRVPAEVVDQLRRSVMDMLVDQSRSRSASDEVQRSQNKMYAMLSSRAIVVIGCFTIWYILKKR